MSQKEPAKPTSDARIAANRANAAKSTGPRTPEGKAVSSMNALKHGLTARRVVVLNDPDEDPAEFDNLLDELIGEHQPDGVTERFLVERIAVCYWRLRRALRYEAQSAADRLLARQQDPSGQTPAGPAADPLSDGGPIVTLIRYESMIDRQLNRAMAQLAYLRQTRPMVLRQTSPVAPNAAGDPDSAGNSGLVIGNSDLIGHCDLDIGHSAAPARPLFTDPFAVRPLDLNDPPRACPPWRADLPLATPSLRHSNSDIRHSRPASSPTQDAPPPAAQLNPPARPSLGEGVNPGEGGSPSTAEAPNEANAGASGKPSRLRQPAIIGVEARRQAPCPPTGG